MSESRILRDRTRNVNNKIDRAGGDLYGSAAIVGVTTTFTTYPTNAGSYYAISPGQITDQEVEGQPGTVAPDGQTTVWALNVGSQVPPSGTPVIAHGCGGRLVFRFDG